MRNYKKYFQIHFRLKLYNVPANHFKKSLPAGRRMHKNVFRESGNKF
jgi:hypothetical protein